MKRLRPSALALLLLLLLTAYPVTAQFSAAEREKSERLIEILAALDLSPGKWIADIGSGPGFYSLRMARAVAPSGRVTAVDVDKAALDQLHARLQLESVTNVDITLAAPDDPRLAADTYDAALIYNGYHDMSEYPAVLRGILKGLKPGGRLVVIESIHDVMRLASRADQTAKHEIADDLAAEEFQRAGFLIGRRDPTFRPFTDADGVGRWWLIVATKPSALITRASVAGETDARRMLRLTKPQHAAHAHGAR